jgi:hypothetical protein
MEIRPPPLPHRIERRIRMLFLEDRTYFVTAQLGKAVFM